MIVGLGHYARTGKDTVAQILVDDHGFTRVAFADALRDLVRRIDPMISMLVAIDGWEKAKDTTPAVREKLVDVGMACREILGTDVWIRALEARLDPDRDYVITDVRFPNELAWLLDTNGVAVKIIRPGFEPLDNVADQALVGADGWHFVIDNDSTIDDLRSLVAKVLHQARLSKELHGYLRGR